MPHDVCRNGSALSDLEAGREDDMYSTGNEKQRPLFNSSGYVENASYSFYSTAVQLDQVHKSGCLSVIMIEQLE